MEPRRRRRDGVRSRGAGGSGRANRPRRPRADAEMAGTVREETCRADGVTRQPDVMAHPPGVHPSGAAQRRPARARGLGRTVRLAGEMRAAIREGSFARWADAWRRRYLQPELA